MSKDKNNKKLFELPILQVVIFADEDIIATSGTSNDPENKDDI